MTDTSELLKPFDAFLYCRVSSDEQMDRGTITNQIEFGHQYAKLHRANLLAVFTDDGVSGVLPLDVRPGGEQLLAACRQHPGARVLVYAVDRLGRDVKVVVDAVYDLENLGCAVRSMTQPFDTADALGKAVLALLAGFAAMERESILARTRMGSRRKARAGGYLGGKPPFGLEISGRGSEAELILSRRTVEGMDMPIHEFYAYLYQRVAGGTSSVALAEELAKRGIPPPAVLMQQPHQSDDPRWHGPAIVRLIQNTAAKGIYSYGKRGRKGEKRDAANIIERPCPRIVSDELWDKANQRIHDNRRYAGRETERQYLLRSLIRCGNCNGPYTGQTQKPDGIVRKSLFVRYRCNNRARGSKCKGRSVTAEIEKVIWEDIFLMMQSSDELIRRMRYSYKPEDETQDLERINADLSKLRDAVTRKSAEKERMLSLYRRGRISDDELDKSLDEIDAETISLNMEVQRLESVAQSRKERALGRDHLIKTVEVMHQHLRVHGDLTEAYGWTWERKREIILELVHQVTVTTNDENEVSINLKYAFEDFAGKLVGPDRCTSLTSALGQVNFISTLV